jgi:hypothetical protein
LPPGRWPQRPQQRLRLKVAVVVVEVAEGAAAGMLQQTFQPILMPLMPIIQLFDLDAVALVDEAATLRQPQKRPRRRRWKRL